MASLIPSEGMSSLWCPALVAVDAGLFADERAMARVRRALRDVLARPSDVTCSRGMHILILCHGWQEEIDYTEKVGFFGGLARDYGVTVAQARVRSRADDPRAIMSFYASYVPGDDRTGQDGASPFGAEPLRAKPFDTIAGKRILHLARRRSPFIEPFIPPPGVVCHRFLKGAIANGCPFDCSYCYLQLTLRARPAVTVYLNLEDMFAELPFHDQKAALEGQPRLLNLGELADAVEPFPWLAGEVCEAVRAFPHLGVLLLTKSSRLPEVAPLHDGVVCSVSLTNPAFASLLEEGTASPEARLDALKRVAEETPARLRVRLDPILIQGEELDGAYRELIEGLGVFGRRLEVVTLGQLRFARALLPLVARRHPESLEMIQAIREGGVLEGDKVRQPAALRLAYYHLVGGFLDDRAIPWGVCKETPEVVVRLSCHSFFCPGWCNCIEIEKQG